jgi:hypothetical protein
MKSARFVKKVKVSALGTTALLSLFKESKVAVNEIEPIYLTTTEVAGVQFYNGERLEKFYAPGTKLGLKLDEENPFDENAVEVLFEGFKIGYLPRMGNSIPSNLLRYGKELYAEIADFNPKVPGLGRVMCKVFMK